MAVLSTDQVERHELGTMTLLGITGAIAAIASAVTPDPGIKLVATLGAAANFTFLALLTMEGWGRIGADDDARNRELKPGKKL